MEIISHNGGKVNVGVDRSKFTLIKKVNSSSSPHSRIMSYTIGINSYKPLLPYPIYRILFIQVPAAV